MTGSDNEDIEQEVYIRTWKNLDKYKEQGKFKSWINTITANLCRDYIKSAYFRNESTSEGEESLLNIADKNPTPENIFIKRQRQNTVINAIESLKPKLKEVVVMYEIKNMSYEEISEKLKCPAGTVRSRLFNARKELSIKLKDLI